MPISTALRKLLCCTTGIQQEEEADAPARLPLPEPMEAGPEPAQARRPYRDFAEREAEQFRQEIENDGSLAEPSQQEAAAVLPALPRAQRSSPGPAPALTRKHMAVVAMQMHLVERGVIKPPYSRLEECPNHVEALIQLADEAGWLARENLAPTHPPRRMSGAEAVIDLVLHVLQAFSNSFLPGGRDRGFGR